MLIKRKNMQKITPPEKKVYFCKKLQKEMFCKTNVV